MLPLSLTLHWRPNIGSPLEPRLCTCAHFLSTHLHRTLACPQIRVRRSRSCRWRTSRAGARLTRCHNALECSALRYSALLQCTRVLHPALSQCTRVLRPALLCAAPLSTPCTRCSALGAVVWQVMCARVCAGARARACACVCALIGTCGFHHMQDLRYRRDQRPRRHLQGRQHRTRHVRPRADPTVISPCSYPSQATLDRALLSPRPQSMPP